VLLYEWRKNFSMRKEKSLLPSVDYFRLNGEEKLKNEVLIILLRNLVKLKTIDVDRLN
jgi:hypothetical protein